MKNELRTTEWIKAINRKGFKPSTSSRICSDHFMLDDFKDSPGGSYRLYLTDKACPSKFPKTFYESHKKKNKLTSTEESTCSQNVDCILDTEVSENTSVHNDEITISRDNLLITPSKIRRTLFYTSPRFRRKKQPETPTKSRLRKKIKFLQLKARRNKCKISNLKDLVKDLQEKQLLEKDSVSLLLDKFEDLPQEIVGNMIKNKIRKKTGCRYSKTIKEFALTLHFYSPKAYEYARYVLYCFINLYFFLGY